MGTVTAFPLTTVLFEEAAAIPDRIVTSGASITVAVDDRRIVLNYGSNDNVALALPALASRDPLGADLEVFDANGKIGTMTFTPDGTDKIMGAVTPWTVFNGQQGTAQTGGSLKLIPVVGVGWLVR